MEVSLRLFQAFQGVKRSEPCMTICAQFLVPGPAVVQSCLLARLCSVGLGLAKVFAQSARSEQMAVAGRCYSGHGSKLAVC